MRGRPPPPDSTSGHPRRFGVLARSPTPPMSSRQETGSRLQDCGEALADIGIARPDDGHGAGMREIRADGCIGQSTHGLEGAAPGRRLGRGRFEPLRNGDGKDAVGISSEPNDRQRATGRRAGDQQIDHVGFGSDLRRQPLKSGPDETGHERRRHVGCVLYIPLGGVGRRVHDVGRDTERLREQIGIGGHRGGLRRSSQVERRSTSSVSRGS